MSIRYALATAINLNNGEMCLKCVRHTKRSTLGYVRCKQYVLFLTLTLTLTF